MLSSAEQQSSDITAAADVVAAVAAKSDSRDALLAAHLAKLHSRVIVAIGCNTHVLYITS